MLNVSPRNSEYDAFGESFALSRKGMKWPEMDVLLNVLSEECSHSSKRRPHVLEVGSGSWRFLETLRAKIPDCEYIGIDSSKVLLRCARKRFPNERFIEGDMREIANLPEILEKAPYDAIIAVASFHHLLDSSDRASTLRAFARILFPGGLLLMTNWNLFSASNTVKYASYREGESNVFHIPFSGKPRSYFGFSETLLRSELSMADFETVHFEANERNIVTISRRTRTQ